MIRSRRTIVAIIIGASLAALVQASALAQGGAVKIVLVGDSTVATASGWGPGFCAVMTKNVDCEDVAISGRSTKSYIEEGAWKNALDLHGDYYLIQFGHNDQKTDSTRFTDPNTTFPANLHRFIADVRAIGAVPVLITSLSRRTYKDGILVEDLTPYVEATRRVGADEHVAVIDLNALSVAMLKKMTQEEADKFNAAPHPPEANAENTGTQSVPTVSLVTAAPDRTHLNPYGQAVFGRIVAEQLVRAQVELAPDLSNEPTETPAQQTPPAAQPASPEAGTGAPTGANDSVPTPQR